MGSDFLFASPSFLSGFARIGDIAGRFDRYNISRSPKEADLRALYADWAVVGENMRAAIAQFDALYPAIAAAAEAVSGIEVPDTKQLSLPLTR